MDLDLKRGHKQTVDLDLKQGHRHTVDTLWSRSFFETKLSLSILFSHQTSEINTEFCQKSENSEKKTEFPHCFHKHIPAQVAPIIFRT